MTDRQTDTHTDKQVDKQTQTNRYAVIEQGHIRGQVTDMKLCSVEIGEHSVRETSIENSLFCTFRRKSDMLSLSLLA